MNESSTLFEYVLRFADSDLVLAQRLGEWAGKAPILEEDIALTNVGLDLLGQARLWFAYAGEVETKWRGCGRSEDELAFLRDGSAFRNLLLTEQPNGTYADTIARQFYFDQWHFLVLQALSSSTDLRVAEIAAKGAKEVAYHIERSADWVIRLGDGTEESHRKMQKALDDLWMYTGEMFEPDSVDLTLIETGIAADVRALHAPWLSNIARVFDQATLVMPTAAWMQGANGRGGKQGVHTEHLGHMLAEMQSMQRAYPGLQW
ncbi:MAG TPA: 1,2-phenylacetyl-CoA epoxidase subunit PaaC [Casimicrobiaceae bacterium]|jgi:ring-1,2-phenylacetyl-CoA epoxidase subunit PaaC